METLLDELGYEPAAFAIYFDVCGGPHIFYSAFPKRSAKPRSVAFCDVLTP